MCVSDMFADQSLGELLTPVVVRCESLLPASIGLPARPTSLTSKSIARSVVCVNPYGAQSRLQECLF